MITKYAIASVTLCSLTECLFKLSLNALSCCWPPWPVAGYKKHVQAQIGVSPTDCYINTVVVIVDILIVFVLYAS